MTCATLRNSLSNVYWHFSIRKNILNDDVSSAVSSGNKHWYAPYIYTYAATTARSSKYVFVSCKHAATAIAITSPVSESIPVIRCRLLDVGCRMANVGLRQTATTVAQNVRKWFSTASRLNREGKYWIY